MNILFISTGGTLVSELKKNGLSPNDGAAKLRDFFAAHAIPVLDLFSLDSTNVGPAEWIRLAETCAEKARDHEAILIGHGTDTLAYTAAALTFMLPHIAIPIVLTGSQLPLGDENSDAPKNLIDAFSVAASGRAGVHIVFGGRILHGDDARKVNTTEFDAFRNIRREQAGSVEDGRVVWRESQQQNNKAAAADTEKKETTLPLPIDANVMLIRLTPGFRPQWLRAIGEISPAVKGLVIEGFGLGGLPNDRLNLVEPLMELIERGIHVVLTTQVERGQSDLNVYEVGLTAKAAGAIEVPRLIPELIAVKMMVALGQGERLTKEEIAAYLNAPEPSIPGNIRQ